MGKAEKGSTGTVRRVVAASERRRSAADGESRHILSGSPVLGCAVTQRKSGVRRNTSKHLAVGELGEWERRNGKARQPCREVCLGQRLIYEALSILQLLFVGFVSMLLDS